MTTTRRTTPTSSRATPPSPTTKVGNDLFVGKNNASQFSTLPGAITLTIAPGAQTGAFGFQDAGGARYFGLNVFGGHAINITGGNVERTHGYNSSRIGISGGAVNIAEEHDASLILITGGAVTTAIGSGSGAIGIRDGTVNAAISSAAATTSISGGSVASSATLNLGKTVFTGNGLSATNEGVGNYWFEFHNYIGTKYTVAGTLLSGDAVNAAVFGDTMSGDGARRTFNGAKVADSLFLIEDTVVDGIADGVTIGVDRLNTINASPTVTFTAGANVGNVNVSNDSVLNVNGATVNGYLHNFHGSTTNFTDGAAQFVSGYNASTTHISGGTIGALGTAGDSVIRISDGTIANVNFQSDYQRGNHRQFRQRRRGRH